MRIAVVTTFPPSTGSLNEYAYHFIRILRQKPEVSEVVLLTDELPAGQDYETLERVRIIPCWRFGAAMNAKRILAAVREQRPDVVLFNIQFASFGSGKVPATLGLLAPKLVKRAGYPTVVLLHNIMETVDLKGAGFASNAVADKVIRTVGNTVTKLLLGVDLVAVTIPKYVETLEGKYGATNIVLAPHGAFEEAPMPSFELTTARKQIMTFGKFGTYKKIDILVDAYRLLLGEGRDDLELVIAGTDSPNAAGYLEGVASANHDLPHVRYTGYVPEEEVARIFREAAVVVFPYTSTTGSSGVLHQAGDYGKAVVLPHLGDFAEVIKEEGYTGEFFEPNDAQSLAAAIARLLDDSDHRRLIGTQNYVAARGLPMSDVVDWYLLHFEELLKKPVRLAS